MRRSGLAWLGLLALTCVVAPPAAAQRAPAESHTALVERVLEQDARHWFFNRLDPGSVRHVEVASHTDGTLVLRGEYSFNEGQDGWVLVRVVGRSVTCIQYSDRAECEPPRGDPIVVRRLLRSSASDRGFDPARHRPFDTQDEWLWFCLAASEDGHPGIDPAAVRRAMRVTRMTAPGNVEAADRELIATARRRYLTFVEGAATPADRAIARQTMVGCSNRF